MKQNNIVCIDFDNTICAVDSMREITLSRIGQKGLDDMNYLIENATNHENFSDIYHKNISALNVTQQELHDFGKHIMKNLINQDKIDFINFIKNQNFKVCIVSGGIYDIILPFTSSLNIDLQAVLINYDEQGKYISINNSNMFSYDKWLGMKHMDLVNKYDNIILIGDGMNDYRVFNKRQCTHYIKYTEYLDNKKIPESSFVCSNINELYEVFNNNFI